MSPNRRASVHFTAAACMAAAFAAVPARLDAAGHGLQVAGPVGVTSSSYPFGAAAHTRVPSDVAADGYVEEEFFVSGEARVYDWPAAGPAVVRTSGAPYTTRVLVRRPATRAAFSGVAIVELLNPSNLFDLNLAWAISGRAIVRRGDAWVGITAKPVSIETLKRFDPVRYAPLAWTNPLPLSDPRNCERVPGDSLRTTENGLVWDVHRQVAAWIRSAEPSNPLAYGDRAGAVRHVIAWGYSQTGSFLYTYVNAIHPLDVSERGAPLFDAYLIAMASAPSPINQCAPPIPQGDARRTIHEVGVPVVRVMSQSDYLAGIGARLADSDEAPNLTRNYEIAGAAHATPDELTFAAAPADIEKGGRDVPPMACAEGPRSRFPNRVAFNAILVNLERWILGGVPPPRAAPIQVEGGAPVLDRFGNVTGGIRSPFVDVPISTWYGHSTGPSFCRIAGHEVPFDAGRLQALYPNADLYAALVARDVAALVAARFITREDGEALVEDARRAHVPN